MIVDGSISSMNGETGSWSYIENQLIIIAFPLWQRKSITWFLEKESNRYSSDFGRVLSK